MIGDKNKTKKGGFSLIELLVAITVFMTVTTGLFSLLGSAVKYQGRTLSSVELLNNISFATEFMSRSLRMAQKDLIGSCAGVDGNFRLIGDNHVAFLNSRQECVEFYLGDNAIQMKKNGTVQPLTSTRVNVSRLKFFVAGGSQDDQSQPKMTFLIKLLTKEKVPQEMNIENTVSQRQLDVAY
ncbi:MAG: prepilin-type N-terminal cleavage/methylation domain-containing protein [Patescibacteria group bacterium]|nr:prepilin-type N-terminal cleavage/methylation domain-containing protein [Patescibacteria group bacterium]